MRYVIVGGGIAGTTAAEEIRKRESDAEITIVESEFHRLYSRVLLPHYIEGRVDREKVFLKKEDWYAQHGIELMTGVRVEKIDLKNRFVLTSESRELPFDKLLLTIGGELRLLDSSVRGVVYLRSLDDADQIVQLLQEAKRLPAGEARGVVYGGGFIALEFLNIFHKHNIPATLVMRSGGFWSKVLSQESQDVMRRHIETSGVRVIADQKTITVLGEKEVEAIELENGEVLSANILGVGIGIDTDRSLLTDAGVACERGILANEFLETPQENVYTAGDVAQFNDPVIGRPMMYGNWMNAVMQGRAVAKTMTGEKTKFELVSSYASDFLGKDVVFIGDVDREHADEIRQIPADNDSAMELFDRGGKTVGAVLIGDVTKRQLITTAIKSGTKYTP